MSSQIAKVIDATEVRFASIAPRNMSYEAEKGFAIQLLKNNSYLMSVAEKSPNSLQQAITNVAAIGLSLNPAKKQAYLITRNVKVSNNSWEHRVFLEPSYMGMCDLATLSGRIEWVQANAVYSKDTYQNNGAGEKPTHSFNSFGERGDFVGAYCVAKTDSGDFLTTEMDAKQIYDIRERSEAWKRAKSGPWKTDFIEMAKKSVVRNAFKMWPKTKEMDRLSEAVEISNQNEGFEPVVTAPEIPKASNEAKAFLDQCITNSDGIGMYVLQQTIPESQFQDLYHSFEKGTKGKYQSIIDKLLQTGCHSFENMLMDFEAVIDSNDEYGAREVLEDLNDDCKNLMISKLNPEKQSILREMLSE